MAERKCHHGWRGAPAGPIANPCPACGQRALFIAEGGWLTCANLKCFAPSEATDRLDLARALGPSPEEREAMREARSALTAARYEMELSLVRPANPQSRRAKLFDQVDAALARLDAVKEGRDDG